MSEFQTNVYFGYAAGLPGEIAADGPLRAQSCRLQLNAAQSTAVIGFGLAFTYATPSESGNPTAITSGAPPLGANGPFTLSTTAIATPGVDAGAGNFAGVLINPKSHASYGTTYTAASQSGPLAPTYVLPDGSWGELCTMGILFAAVQATAAAKAGAPLYFTATGQITTDAGSAPANTLIPGARLINNLGANGSPQLAKIELTGANP